jgi:hypothetical protein
MAGGQPGEASRSRKDRACRAPAAVKLGRYVNGGLSKRMVFIWLLEVDDRMRDTIPGGSLGGLCSFDLRSVPAWAPSASVA